MDKMNPIQRRKLLKTTGGLLAATTVMSGAAAADGDSGKKECRQCPQVVAETDTEAYVATNFDGKTRVYRVEKETGSIEFTSLDNEVGIQDVSTRSADQLSSLAYTMDIVDRSKGIYEKIGGCGFPVINNHYYAGIAMETNQNPNKYTTSALAGAICASFGVATPLPGDEILAGAVCSVLATAVQDIVFDTTFTAGVYDIDSSYAPRVQSGVSDEYDADYDELSKSDTHLGHIGPVT